MANKGSKQVGFLDLPAELRQRVYSLAFENPKTPLCAGFTRVEQQPVHMYCTKLSSQFLRTCSTVYNEAHPLIFSQNSFLMQEASEFTTLKKAAGDDLSSIRQLCFQSGCKITQPRIKQLKKFDGLETVMLSYDGLPIYANAPVEAEDAAVQCAVQQFEHLALLIAARPDVQYILKVKHARQDKEVTICSASFASLLMAPQGSRSIEHVAEFDFGIDDRDPPKVTARFLRLRRKDNGEEVELEK